MRRSLQSLSANLGERTRRERLQGRMHLVAPVTLIVPGVLNGSNGPLFYSAKEIERNPEAWNGVPITVDHPADDDGEAISARSPGVLNRSGIGVVLKARSNGKLIAEAWFDIARTLKVEPSILHRLNRGEPIEVSTGLFTDVVRRNGTFNGRSYIGVARKVRPDHLAVLPNSIGACSLSDGCGVLNEGEDEWTIEELEYLEKLAARGSRENTAPAKSCKCGSHRTHNSEDEGPGLTPSIDFEELAHPGLVSALAREFPYEG